MSRRKIITLAIVFLSIVALVSILYFFSIYRAEYIVRKMVKTQSEGKMYFKASRVKLDMLNLRFEFKNAELRTIDSSNTFRGYHVKADRLFVNVHSLLSVIRGKHVIIDTVLIQAPTIEVIKYREGKHHKKVSLTHELSKVYESLDKVLKVINLNYLKISDAKFRIYDRSKPGIRPLQLANLNLTIDKVAKEQIDSNNKFLHADRILLEIFNEEITFPDGNHSISFKRFWMGTRSRMVKLDSCYIMGNASDTNTGSFKVFIDSLRISKLDFNALAQHNTVKFDSALCINPKIDFYFKAKAGKKKSTFNAKRVVDSDSIDHKLKKMLGNLDINYLAVRNAKIKIVTSKLNKTSTFKTDSSNFSISGFYVNSADSMPLKLGNLNFNVHNYESYSKDSMFIIRFNDVVISDRKIFLNNLSYRPSKLNHDPFRKEIVMEAFEIDRIDWMALLYENKLVAGQASLIKPDLYFVLQPKDNQAQPKPDKFSILGMLHSKISIDRFFIKNGTVRVEVKNGPKFLLSDCYADIDVNTLLSVDEELKIINAIDSFAFTKGEFKNAGTVFALKGFSFSKTNNSLYLNAVSEIKADKSQAIQINRVRLLGIAARSRSEFSLDELSWANARLIIENTGEKKVNQSKTGLDINLRIGRIKGGSTHIDFSNPKLSSTAHIKNFSTGSVSYTSGEKPVVQNLFIEGEALKFNQPEKLSASIATFTVSDGKPSSLLDVKAKLPLKGEYAQIDIPEIRFKADVQKTILGEITAEYIEISKPSIEFTGEKSAQSDSLPHSKKAVNLPRMQVGRITMERPELSAMASSAFSGLDVHADNSKWNLLSIHSDGKKLTADSLKILVEGASLNSKKVKLSSSGSDNINLLGSAISFTPATNELKAKWAFTLNTLKLNDLHLETLKNDTVSQQITLHDLDIENLHLNDATSGSIDEIVAANDNMSLTDGNIKLENNKTRLQVYNLVLRKANSSLSIDSMSFSPVSDRETFMKTKEFQTVYLQMKTGKIDMKGINFAEILSDTVMHSSKVVIQNWHLMTYKDKRLPFRHGVEKPMLTDLIENINPKIRIDSIVLKNGLIDYEEFNDKTQKFGKINLTHVKGAVSGFRTYNPAETDSLHFNMYAKLLDTAELYVKYKQSYTDSLSGFNLGLIVKPFNLTALNPMLGPFASAKLNRGVLDTIRMSAIGRKYVALGEMKMYYRNLNAEFLKKGDTLSKTVVTKSVSFFANRIVHTKNQRGEGEVYAERDPEKGFVNYWVKIVIGGVFTNTGVRTNIKQERKYQKGIKKHGVPPIPPIPVDFD